MTLLPAGEKNTVRQGHINYVKNNVMFSKQNDEKRYKTLHMTSLYELNTH